MANCSEECVECLCQCGDRSLAYRGLIFDVSIVEPRRWVIEQTEKNGVAHSFEDVLVLKGVKTSNRKNNTVLIL